MICFFFDFMIYEISCLFLNIFMLHDLEKIETSELMEILDNQSFKINKLKKKSEKTISLMNLNKKLKNKLKSKKILSFIITISILICLSFIFIIYERIH